MILLPGTFRFIALAVIGLLSCATLSASAQTASSVLGFSSVADLRAYNTSGFGSTAPHALTGGYYVAGDGGENRFVWSGSSTATDNGGTIIRPTAIVSGSPGRWLATNTSPINVKAFGAKGDMVTDDSAAINTAIVNAGSTSRAVHFPAGIYLINSPITIPLNMDSGVIQGTLFTTLLAGSSFLPNGGTMMAADPSISRLTIRDLRFQANSRVAIGIDLTRSAESSIRHLLENVYIDELPSNSTGIILDGCEDTVLRRAEIFFANGATNAKSLSWHVPTGNLWIENCVTFQPIYLSYQNASITASTLGAIVADGDAFSLGVFGCYLYPDTGTTKANFRTTGNNGFGSIQIISSWMHNGGVNVVAFQGKYGDVVKISGSYFPKELSGSYSLFSSSTQALPGATPSFLLEGPSMLLGGTTEGTPNTGVAINAPLSSWQTYSTTPVAQSGSFTSASATGAYRRVGKTVTVRLAVNITNVGTATVGYDVPLPIPAKTGVPQTLHASDAAYQSSGSGFIVGNVSVVTVKRYDNAFLGTNGSTVVVQGEYETD